MKRISKTAFFAAALLMLGFTTAHAGSAHFNGNFAPATAKGDCSVVSQQPNGVINYVCNPSDNTCFTAGGSGADFYWPSEVMPPTAPGAVSGTLTPQS